MASGWRATAEPAFSELMLPSSGYDSCDTASAASTAAALCRTAANTDTCCNAGTSCRETGEIDVCCSDGELWLPAQTVSSTVCKHHPSDECMAQMSLLGSAHRIRRSHFHEPPPALSRSAVDRHPVLRGE